MHSDKLGIYLNDHWAGATFGVGIARRMAHQSRHSVRGADLTRIAEEIAQEVDDIRRGLHRAGLPPDRPFDIAVRGNANPAWQEDKNVDLKGLAQAGVTWWLESLIHFDPLNLSMAFVDAGPPRM